MRVKGAGQVWVHVCKSKKKDAEGVICSDESIGQAKKKGSTFAYKPKFFDFPELLAEHPGHLLLAGPPDRLRGRRPSDCQQEGQIVKFKVG